LLDTARQEGHLGRGAVAVACSGGADSLALAAAAVHAGHRRALRVHGLVVDHGLQDDSAAVARQAAATLVELGCDQVQVLAPVVAGRGGPEAAARKARYAALRGALPVPDALILLGHTRDDQAETVLLGLGRGSGPRSIAGMRPLDPPWARPLLDVPRITTADACAALGLRPWSDPHNSDPRFTRVRLRAEVLPLLEDVLRGGVTDALARTAAQVREDCDALDALAGELLARSRDADELDCKVLADAHPAIRRRALRRWLLDSGVRELTDPQLRAVDGLTGSWRGQGGVWLTGALVAQRVDGRLRLDAAAR
jgi:tRNA(Ile)-lysidine synthase